MKPKILFFPSAWCTEAVFAPQIELLKNDFELIFPNVHQFNDIEKMADFVVANYQDVYAIIGLSMGGFVVQAILKRSPRFAKKVVLMGTYCHGHDETTKAFYNDLSAKIQAGEFEELITVFINAVISKARAKDESLRKQMGDLPRSLGQSACTNHCKACANWNDHTEAAKNIKAETLIIAGTGDDAVPMKDLEQLHTLIPNSKLQLIQNAGHLIGLEEPQQVNQAIINFLVE